MLGSRKGVAEKQRRGEQGAEREKSPIAGAKINPPSTPKVCVCLCVWGGVGGWVGCGVGVKGLATSESETVLWEHWWVGDIFSPSTVAGGNQQAALWMCGRFVLSAPAEPSQSGSSLKISCLDYFTCATTKKNNGKVSFFFFSYC